MSAIPEYIAIGDIHGLASMLGGLLERLPASGTLVFLGDYLDRGPDSCRVIERLIELAAARPCVFLRGNHEAMALDALDGDLAARETWLRNGGLATLDSYGGAIPAPHVAFLRATHAYFETDDLIFVHAGIPPGKRPAEVDPEMLWWMREPFLSSDYNWGKLVIHGHTPTSTRRPDVRSNRINIDTGAIYGGALTAILLPEREFIAVDAERST